MTSILFNNGIEIVMKGATTNRGNRHIHTSNNIANLIPLNGSIKILKKNKQLYELTYNINKEDDSNIPSSLKWHQLNPANDQFVVQIKALYCEDNTLMVKKVAIQELSGIKDVLLNI